MKTGGYIIRRCKKCKQQQRFDYPKREIVFGFHDEAPFHCVKCNFNVSDYAEVYGADLDEDILTEWATNEDLHLMEQDEELLLSQEHYLELVIKFLDETTTLNSKKNILMEALCVLTYDLLRNKGNEQLLGRLKNELLKRKQLLLESEVLEYLLERILPFLEMKK